MDPITQGALGAAAAQAAAGSHLKHAWLVGLVGGVLADVDVLVRSSEDPLLAIEYHRQFTHALIFIPVGGFIAALPWIVRKRHREKWKWFLGTATTAYATHGLLDACTTYGTQLFWPFSSYRVAWSWISIVDPIFTLVLLTGVVWSARSRTRAPAAVALGLCVLYLILGAVQRERVLDAQQRIAETRTHQPVRADAFPTIGNHLVWRSLYQAGDSIYADRIRKPWWGRTHYTSGTSVRLEPAPTPATSPDFRVRRDFERFRHFSAGWVARDPVDTTVIGDVRYSLRTNAFEPIWGIRFHPNERVPTEWVDRTRDRSLSLDALWSEITGTDTTYRPIPSGH